MASVLNRKTLEYIGGVNTPDYPVIAWIINPDMTAVWGKPVKFWRISGDVVSLASGYTCYSYSINSDTKNGSVAQDKLNNEILAITSLKTQFSDTFINGMRLDIWFKSPLSDDAQSDLTTAVYNHDGVPTPAGPQDVNIKSAASTAVILSQEKGFQDLTGHNFYKKGIHGTATAGQTTDFYLKFSANMYLPGGGYRVGPTASFGDYIGVQIVDKDGILGYGPGLVLGTFIDTDYCWGEKEWEVLTGDAKMIPAGIYLRMRYVSTGSEAVDIIGWYSMRT
jgi:hypothetical protein